MAKRYIFGAGGTSGHINPALAIADHIKRQEPDAKIMFCGMEDGLEQEMTRRAGYDMSVIRALSMPGQKKRRFFRFLKENSAGVLESRKLIKSFQPDAVIGTGGYVSGPLVMAALWSGVPVLLHEQNAYPGRTNRLLAPYTKSVCISFAESGKYFSKGTRLILSGNPVKPAFFEAEKDEARASLNIKEETFLILLLGGSLGANSLTNTVIGLKDDPAWHALRERYDVRIQMSTGIQKADEFLPGVNAVDGVTAVPYLHSVENWMAASDLFIGRAGAMTCAELAATGTPSILVPYPYAANDHQTFNAMSMKNAGAAEVIQDKQLTTTWLIEAIGHLIEEPDKRRVMGQSAKRLAIHDALDIIYQELGRIRKNGH